MAEPTLEELEKTNPNYFARYNDPKVDAPPPRNPLAMRRYTPAGPSATSYNPNSYNPSQSRPQSGVVRTGPSFNYTERTGITAGPVETFQRQADGSITRDGVTVKPPRVSAAGDFASAARQPMQASGLQVNPIQAAQDRGTAMRRQAADQERQNATTANGYKADAISTLLGEWRKNGRVEAIPQSAPIYGTQGVDGKSRIVGYGPAAPTANDPTRRIAMLEPAAVRELNSMRKQLGLGETDKIVGMVAVGDGKADAQTGKPSFIIRYRDANGRIRSEAMSYGSAARFVQDARKAGGNANAEYDMANDEMWGDPLRYKGTSGYLETKGRLDAADLKNQQTRQQIEQGRATFEQQQADRAKADRNRPVTEAKAEVDRLDKLAAAEKDESTKQNWISQANKARKVLADRQAEARLADITDATEEGASPDNMPQFIKKGGKLVLKDGWMMKKQANGKSSIVPKPGWMLDENGELVKKPQKPGAKPSAPAATAKPRPANNPSRRSVERPTRSVSPTIAEGSNAQRAAIKRAATSLLNLVGRNYIPD